MKTALSCLCLLALINSALAKDSPPASLEEMWQVIQAQQAQMDELKSDNAAMRERIDSTMGPGLEETLVESEDRSTAASAAVAEMRDTRLEIYGKVQLDAIYDFNRVDPDWKDASRPSKIPVQDPAVFGGDGETILSARQTTLGMRAENDTPMGKVKSWMEWDLYAMGNDAGELELNTKHLWFEWGNWGAGQTNTNFMDANIFPNTIDYWGPPGMIYVRKPQIRYTRWVGASGSHWSISIEDPSSDVDPGDAREIDPDLAEALQTKDSAPDITVKWRGLHEWGHYQVAAIARKLDVESVSDGLGVQLPKLAFVKAVESGQGFTRQGAHLLRVQGFVQLRDLGQADNGAGQIGIGKGEAKRRLRACLARPAQAIEHSLGAALFLRHPAALGQHDFAPMARIAGQDPGREHADRHHGHAVGQASIDDSGEVVAGPARRQAMGGTGIDHVVVDLS